MADQAVDWAEDRVIGRAVDWGQDRAANLAD